MSETPRSSPELRELAVKMVLELRADYKSDWAAVTAGVSPKTLRTWVQRTQVDQGCLASSHQIAGVCGARPATGQCHLDNVKKSSSNCPSELLLLESLLPRPAGAKRRVGQADRQGERQNR